MDNQYIEILKELRQLYLTKSEELFTKMLEEKNDMKRMSYNDRAMEFLGLAEGLSMSIRLYKYR